MQADVTLGRMAGPQREDRSGVRDVRPVELSLPASTEAPALARQAAALALGGWPREQRDTVLLVVSELMTNAVRHGSTGPEHRVGMRVEPHGSATRIEVTDCAAGDEVVATAPGERELPMSGWGLSIVAELTDRWGVERAPSLTRVWCELDAC